MCKKEEIIMNYTKEDKLRIIKLYLDGISPYPDDLTPSQKSNLKKKIKKWVNIYKQCGEEGLEPKVHRFTAEERLSAVERVLKGESRYQVAYSMGIHDKKTVRNWVNKYLKEGKAGLKDGNSNVYFNPGVKNKDNTSFLLEENARLKEKVNELEAEVVYLKKLQALIQK